MATQAQIKANRQNAKKSTGPKTAEGKAAVSQNAVKHGLFTDSVVTGETEAEYAAFHRELLAELDPRGVMELLLAERVVSLWWRLRRAERMQNQAIEDKIGRFVTNKSSRSSREYYLLDQGIRPGDPGFDLDDLPLGRIANDDFANSRLLDRMLLYERRIESSLNRAMKELKSFQTMRRIEWKEAALRKNKSFFRDPFMAEAATRFSEAENYTDLKKQSQSPAFGRKSEMLSPKSETTAFDKLNLKKQSQFPVDDIDIKAFLKIAYGDNEADEAEENKAKRTCPEPVERSESPLAPRDALGVEEGKSVTAATG
jgi:hypothetical protein